VRTGPQNPRGYPPRRFSLLGSIGRLRLNIQVGAQYCVVRRPYDRAPRSWAKRRSPFPYALGLAAPSAYHTATEAITLLRSLQTWLEGPGARPWRPRATPRGQGDDPAFSAMLGQSIGEGSKRGRAGPTLRQLCTETGRQSERSGECEVETGSGLKAQIGRPPSSSRPPTSRGLWIPESPSSDVPPPAILWPPAILRP
jgi:hypothetical protein